LLRRLLDFRGRRYAAERAALEAGAGPREVAAFLLRWRLNWEDGSRASLRRDVEHLMLLAERACALGHEGAGRELLELCREYLEVLNDDGAFRADGRMMKVEAARRAAELIRAVELGARKLAEGMG